MTVCILDDGKQVASGMAICSDLDQPCKKRGRAIAEGRAWKAWERQASLLPINRKKVIEQLAELDVLSWYKCHYQYYTKMLTKGRLAKKET